MSKVAVIIINYNTYQKTKKCIDILRENTTVDYHIYLLDNGSKNESLHELKRYYEDAEDVTLIASEENLGYARGNNKLLQRAVQDESQFAVIMNNDIFLMNNAIDLMIEDLQNDKDISFVGPHMVGTKGEIQLTSQNTTEASGSFPPLSQLVANPYFFERVASPLVSIYKKDAPTEMH